MKSNHCLLFLLLLGYYLSTAQNKNSEEGIWQMRGYGLVFVLDGETIKTYDTTRISCLPNAEYPRKSLLDSFVVANDVLTVKVGLSTYHFDRLQSLPELCATSLSKKQRKDPIFNFEVLWNTFNEQYAYFELRGIDWQASYAKYKSQVTNKTTEVELYRIFYTMLDDLNDGHVDIEASDKVVNKAFPDSTDNDEVSFKEISKDIAAYYVNDLKTHNYTKSLWGKINDNVGFLQVNDMAAQAHYGLTPDMPKDEAEKMFVKAAFKAENYMRDETEGMRKTMQNVLKDLAGVKHLIVDVRFNGGGFDTVSFEIIRALTQEPFIAFKKYARQGDDTTEPYFYELEPANANFSGQVYLLQSAFSGSATETMLLASTQMPNVTRIGAASEGILSDALEKVLPNGWDFTLSNEAYETPDGINYENLGIPVDVELSYPVDEQGFYDLLQQGITSNQGDLAIEYVLE